MNISIFHGLPNMHYEMLGYIIDYFHKMKNNFINIKYYFNPKDKEKTDWLQVYKDVFNIDIKWDSILNFNPENYSLIFLITDDDYYFKDDWFIIYGPTKVISINHLNKNRGYNNVFYNIHTRYIYTNPSASWALPCYQGINKVDKLKLINNNKIKIACVGKFLPPSVIYFKNIFENVKDLEIHIICRKNDITKIFDFNRYNDNEIELNIHIDMSTINMINLIKECSYVFCCKAYNLFYSKQEGIYNNNKLTFSLSGIIPIGLSYGCQLIIPSSWQEYYNLSSAITYNENISYNKLINNSSKIKLLHHTKESLDIVYNELNDLINHKNIIFDNIISLKDSNIEYNINNNCWFSNICNKLNIKKPNVFIEVCTYLDNKIDLIKDNFRQIHIIESSSTKYNDQLIKYKNDSNIIFHLGDSLNILDKIIFKIKEPIMFYLDILSSNNTILDILPFISKHYCQNIIIINNVSYIKNISKEYLKQIYNRPSMFYNISDMDRLVIIPIR